jgi:hypothetical protein
MAPRQAILYDGPRVTDANSAVETMKPKALLALALASAIGGPAWSQDASRDRDSNPYEQNSNPDAQYVDPYQMNNEDRPDDSASEPSGSSPYGGETRSFERAGGGSTTGWGQGPNGVQTAPSSRPQILGPSGNPYAGWKPSRFDEDLTETNRRDREFDQQAEDGAYDPLSPPKEEAPNPYGVNPLGAGETPAGGGRPKPPAPNGGPSGALGFNPYDINSILAPKSQFPNKGASTIGSDATGAIGGDRSDSSANASTGPAFPSLGPTTPGARVH